VATERPRRRKSAAPPSRKTVKASLSVGVDLHARWAAAAALRGMDRNAFAVEALESALKGLVIVSRGNFAGAVDPSGEEDRQDAA
jgi:hypothetical protein